MERSPLVLGDVVGGVLVLALAHIQQRLDFTRGAVGQVVAAGFQRRLHQRTIDGDQAEVDRAAFQREIRELLGRAGGGFLHRHEHHALVVGDDTVAGDRVVALAARARFRLPDLEQRRALGIELDVRGQHIV